MKLYTIQWCILVIILCGCERPNVTPERGATPAVPVQGINISETEPGVARFSIESHGKFNAGFDNNIREILLITDRKTGKVYLGITGVGISELRSESSTSVDADGHFNTTTETKER